jgi:hypothetical protein
MGVVGLDWMGLEARLVFWRREKGVPSEVCAAQDPWSDH